MKIYCENCDYELCDIDGNYTCTYCSIIGPIALNTKIRCYSKNYNNIDYIMKTYSHEYIFKKLLQLFQYFDNFKDIPDKCYKTMLKYEMFINTSNDIEKLIKSNHLKCYELIPKLCLIFLNYKLSIIKECHKVGIINDFRNVCVKARQRFKRKTLFPYHFILNKL